jgi:hypothetical protein
MIQRAIFWSLILGQTLNCNQETINLNNTLLGRMLLGPLIGQLTFTRAIFKINCSRDSYARIVVKEGQDLSSFLFLNNNFSVVHHMHPSIAWYHLPAL